MIYKHRINSIPDLEALDADMGLEVDVRYHDEHLVIAHDAYHGSCLKLEDFLGKVRDRRIIFNIKSEGLEDRVRALCEFYSIKGYAFLDCSVPYIIKGIKNGQSDYLLRVSKYEGLRGFRDLKSGLAGIWLDHFDGSPVSQQLIEQLKSFGLPVILVSPELHGYSTDKIEEMIRCYNLHFKKISVCTKRPDLWRELNTVS